MDIETFRNWVIAISAAISVISAIVVWLNSPGRKIEAGLKQVSAALDEHKRGVSDALKGHDRRIQKVEDEMRHLPTKDDLGELTNEVTSLRTEVSMMGKVVDRIDEYLREHK